MISLYEGTDLFWPYELVRFSGGELHPKLEARTGVTHATIYADLRRPEEPLELLLVTDAVYRLNPLCRVDLVCPYLPYARHGLYDNGFASGNLVFGIGSYTYQHATRDSFGCAVKATFGVVDGEDRELWKDPKTDNGTKRSARGLLRVEKEGADYVLYDRQTRAQGDRGLLETVFLNGWSMRQTPLYEVRARLGW